MTDPGHSSDEVYDPAEDSFLLASACVREIAADELVIDVGTGSGVIAHRIGEATGATVVGVDINPVACRRAADAGVPVLRGDLLSPFARACADVVVCNPPYLPTSPAEVRDDWLSVAVDGGPTGRAVVESLLDDLGRVLRPRGRAYLLVSSLMNVAAVREYALDRGFEGTQLDRDDSFPFEVLSVLRLELTSSER